jgi:hypothetical protein
MNLVPYDYYSNVGGRKENEDAAIVWSKMLSGKCGFLSRIFFCTELFFSAFV